MQGWTRWPHLRWDWGSPHPHPQRGLLRYNYKDFSVGSWKAMVDIDAAELFKPTINVDLKIACDCKVGRVSRGVALEYP